jgi:hypothetical protein
MIANVTAPVQRWFLKSTIRSGRLVDKGDTSFWITGRSPRGSNRPSTVIRPGAATGQYETFDGHDQIGNNRWHMGAAER